LTALLAVRAAQAPNPHRWLFGAAVVAGLATGTKYPGGLLLIPVLIASWPTLKNHDKRGRLILLGGIGIIFVSTYLLSTPGTLLASDEFIHDVRFEIQHYGRDGHGIHTVEWGLPHLRLNLGYLSLAALSWYKWLALPLFGLALVGGAAAWRENRTIALILVLFPLVYVLYMSLQRVMFVRNLMVVLPFLALLA